MKKKLLLLISIIVVIILALTYALVIYRSDKTRMTLTWEGNLGEYINYKNGTPVLGSNNAVLNPATDYTSGISTTIEFWKTSKARNLDIMGHIYLDLTTMSDTLTEEPGLKWAVSSNGILLSEGNFNNYHQGDSVPILFNQKLLSEFTTFTISIWLDENSLENYEIEGETLSTLVRAEASYDEYIIDNKNLVVNGFNYVDNTIQKLNITTSGFYKLEVWGAQGGYGMEEVYRGGYGGYSKGVVSLNQGDTLYIGVGGAGMNATIATTDAMLGGFNGGGTSYGNDKAYRGGGGGATHIALVDGVLSTLSASKDNILIVAGGGGAGAYVPSSSSSSTGGDGGGYTGNDGTTNGTSTIGKGGTQTAGGTGNTTGKFGQGGTPTTDATGGGGGYYGGGGGQYSAGSGGGSGYIANTKLLSQYDIIKSMYCYNCVESTTATTRTIKTYKATTNPISNYAKQGNGYAKVTLLKPYVNTDRQVIDKSSNYNFYNDTCYDVGNGCTIEYVTYDNSANMNLGEYQLMYVVKDNANNRYVYYKKVEIK